MIVARDGVERPTPAFSGYSQPIPLFGQLLNVSRWPQFCGHSVTSADVRLSVGRECSSQIPARLYQPNTRNLN